MCNKIKGTIILAFILGSSFFTSCTNKINTSDGLMSVLENSSETNPNLKINNDEIIDINILGKKIFSINKDRIGDGNVYGLHQIDNRWELREIDSILNAIKGKWEVDNYVGFAASTVYYLPERFDNVGEQVRSQAEKDYNEKVEKAKITIPELYFSIKEYDDEDSNNNYIYVNDNYLSPISIIVSLDKSYDLYPMMVDQTAVSGDFYAEYPILYIKFFIKDYDDNFKPATLVISSNNQFYILIDGAFYSIKKIDI